MALREPIPDILAGAPAALPRTLQQTFSSIVLDGMPISELLALRTQVEQKLPAKDLKDLDLARELVLQVLALQQLQSAVLADSETPANQQAQVANSLSSALTNLVKLQADVYSSERFKRVEQILIDTLQALPAEAQEQFLAAYAESLEGLR